MLREVVILLSIVTLVKCNQSCWQCSNEPNLALCRTNTRTCAANEQCFVEKTVTGLNEVVYSAGCRSNTICKIMQALYGGATGKRSVTICGNCCTGPHCQDSLCGPMSNGTSLLTCLSCNSATSAGACQNYEVCQDTEVCHAGINIVGSVIRYSFGCEHKHLCRTFAANDVTGHPGRALVNDLHLCDACCVSDQCNKADCFVLRQNMTVSMFSTG